MVTVLNVVLQNHPGSLAEVLEIMARAEINVDAIEAEAQGDFGTVRLLTSKPKLAGELLRQDGYEVVEAEALQLMLPNKYGELARLAKKLADSNVNVVSLFGTSPNGPNDGRLVLRVNDTKAARKVLGISD